MTIVPRSVLLLALASGCTSFGTEPQPAASTPTNPDAGASSPTDAGGTSRADAAADGASAGRCDGPDIALCDTFEAAALEAHWAPAPPGAAGTVNVVTDADRGSRVLRVALPTGANPHQPAPQINHFTDGEAGTVDLELDVRAVSFSRSQTYLLAVFDFDQSDKNPNTISVGLSNGTLIVTHGGPALTGKTPFPEVWTRVRFQLAWSDHIPTARVSLDGSIEISGTLAAYSNRNSVRLDLGVYLGGTTAEPTVFHFDDVSLAAR